MNSFGLPAGSRRHDPKSAVQTVLFVPQLRPLVHLEHRKFPARRVYSGTLEKDEKWPCNWLEAEAVIG